MSQRILTISTLLNDNDKETPLIRLKGLWLNKFGFSCRKRIVVEQKYGELTLKAIDSSDNYDSCRKEKNNGRAK